ncbi:MAG: glyoxalase [Alphaproteobacteria bacterium]|nr:glyoxalase [Alphaproteobacteria bacterium]
MGITAMNHFTVLTDDLAATTKFYGFFGLVPGWRPPFTFPGAWLYSGETPILHVIARDTVNRTDGLLDHMAFSAVDLPGVVRTLKREGYDYDLRRLAGGGIWQLFVRDPAGAKVEFDFAKDEPAPDGYVAPA